jgi:hypothetical protein
VAAFAWGGAEEDHEKTSEWLKSSIFWDVTPCGPLEATRRFGGTYRLLLHGVRISQARKLARKLSAATCFHAGFLIGLF